MRKFRWSRRLRAVWRFFKEAHYTLMGHRVREIRLDIADVRNSVLALRLDGFIEACAHGDARPELAVVSCLPWDETGIARFTETHIAQWDGEFDLFTEITDFRKLAGIIGRLTGRRQASSVFSVDSLPMKAMQRGYERVLFVIGNSDHNGVLLKAMADYIAAFGADNVFCFLHDPVCFNVGRRSLGLTEAEYGKMLAELHGRNFREIGAQQKYIFDNFLAAGIHGPRVLTHKFGVKNFIVNSTAARDIIMQDCGDRSVRIEVLFHPVFPLEIADQPPVAYPLGYEELLIGSFGSPSLEKRTDVIIQACEQLVREGRKLRLLLVGYGGEVYLKRHYGDHPPVWIELNLAQTEAEFQTQMARCHIAVQLRRRNLGESSGVVPTLLRLGKTVIASPIGAFTDYRDAVIYFDGEAPQLAAILREGATVSPQRMAEFAASHDVASFNRALRAILFPPVAAPGGADPLHSGRI